MKFKRDHRGTRGSEIPLRLNVRFGSLAGILRCGGHVRFTPKSGHWAVQIKCPLCANSRMRRLFDHLVGAGEQIVRNCKAERVGGF